MDGNVSILTCNIFYNSISCYCILYNIL